ncbi:type II secretion system GspH family protein [Patescibacteria group bacterium]|nr:type II secretion system GspH family protein [Patescibacteria group bacterium]MBU1075494.1 type II secretion system GspH family protein [Patescibacteria group bacterium]MBU1951360.1 type II secretion system GspH family protein [Patescibacteria group bacterium]
MRNKKGFTLIELLVVIAIIGLLATIAVVALNSARTSSRDAKRIADVRQVQTGLELYFNAETDYPTCTTAATVASLDGAGCADGITTYVSGISNVYDPSGDATTAACLVDATGTCNYSYQGVAEGDSYTILFWLEGDSGSLTGGEIHTASDAGIL